MKTTNTDIDTYLSSLPDEVREDMTALDKKISAIFKGKTRKLWVGTFWGGSEQKIIGYGDLTMINSKKETVEWFMVGLALQKNYISVYNCAKEDNTYAVRKHADKLGKVKTGASSMSFKKFEDVNQDEFWKITELANAQTTS
jgi:hypothetical protein